MHSQFKRFIWSAALAAGSLMASAAFGIGQPTIISGGLPRDASSLKIDFVVQIPNISSAELALGGADNISQSFVITLPEISSSALPFSADKVSGTLTGYLTEYKTHDDKETGTDANGNAVHQLTYYLEIVETQNMFSDASKTSTPIKISFYLGGTSTTPGQNDNLTLTRQIYVINALPAFTSVVGTNKALQAIWTPADTINTSSTSQASVAATTMSVFALDADTTRTTLPGKVFSNSATPDSAQDCTFDPTKTNAEQCISCPTNGYLDVDAISALAQDASSTVHYAQANVSDGSVQITGLENGKDYIVFTQYDPDDIQRSICMIGQPSADITMTELNGEGDAKVVDFRCFIATAAYGSPLHKDLKLFRDFRDEHLLTNPLGKAFVHYYYKYSPPLAHYIAAHPWLKAATRHVLEVPAAVLRYVAQPKQAQGDKPNLSQHR